MPVHSPSAVTKLEKKLRKLRFTLASSSFRGEEVSQKKEEERRSSFSFQETTNFSHNFNFFAPLPPFNSHFPSFNRSQLIFFLL